MECAGCTGEGVKCGGGEDGTSEGVECEGGTGEDIECEGGTGEGVKCKGGSCEGVECEGGGIDDGEERELVDSSDGGR